MVANLNRDTSVLVLLNRYNLWLAAHTVTGGTEPSIHEHNGGPCDLQFSEHILQVFWNEQPFRGPLTTSTGETLEVLAPGTWNVAAGPDFRNAVLRLGGRSVTGDVEIHREENAWNTHGHDHDPLYSRVVLHVVWERDPAYRPPAPLPLCFELQRHVQLPWEQLAARLEVENYGYARRVAAGTCSCGLSAAEDGAVGELLTMAGLARLAEKARLLHQNAIAKGFGQAVYEAAMGAFGYRANQPAMLALAAAVPLADLRACGAAAERAALLLGTAGFLPDPSTRAVASGLGDYVHALWDRWWRLGRTRVPLPWVAAGQRPLNRPERRLMAATLWLEKTACHPDRWLLDLAESASEPRQFVRQFHALCAVRHAWEQLPLCPGGRPLAGALLGRARTNDILVNVVLPFLWAAGEHHGRPAWQELAGNVYRIMPRLQSNRLLVEAAHRLFVPPSRATALAHSACRQQGLLAIYRGFCLVWQGQCAQCPFFLMAERLHGAGMGTKLKGIFLP